MCVNTLLATNVTLITDGILFGRLRVKFTYNCKLTSPICFIREKKHNFILETHSVLSFESLAAHLKGIHAHEFAPFGNAL
jgi:hypothetical protein